MRDVLPAEVRAVLLAQEGVVSRAQATASGLSPQVIDGLLRSGRWRQLQLGVYAAFTGRAPREAVLWAAVLRAGPGAVLSHHTAAELYQLTGPADSGDARTATALVHVTVPVARRVRPAPGLVVHRLARIDQARHPVLQPPRTRVEDTVLDLAESAANFDDAFAWLCRATGRRLTTAARLRTALRARVRARRRAELLAALDDLESGAHSLLEHRYAKNVERAHGLPRARRQARVVMLSRTSYLDNLYEEAGVAVELDGQAAHLAEDRWADIRRDNGHAGAGLITLRYSWADVTGRPCLVARQVAEVLASRGSLAAAPPAPSARRSGAAPPRTCPAFP